MDEFTLNELKEFFDKIKSNKFAFPFLQPIEEVIHEYPDYLEKIPKPLDLNKIELKIYTKKYNSIDEFKEDIDIMLENCFTFNTNPEHWIRRSCQKLKEFIGSYYKKMAQKIAKHYERLSNQTIKQKQQSNQNISSSYGGILNDYDISNNQNLNNIQVVSTTESEKITKKIKSLFYKISNSLNISEEATQDLINFIVKVIVKRTKTLDQVYEDTMKIVSKNVLSDTEKAYFSKKFRKLLRAIKEEQQENLKTENKLFNIKINLAEGVEHTEDYENKEENLKIEKIRKEVFNFIENQKIPEIFREINEYQIEPNLRKKIQSHLNEVRSKYLSTN